MKPRWERWRKRAESRRHTPLRGPDEKPIVPRPLQIAAAVGGILVAAVTVVGFAAGGFAAVGRWIDPPDPPSAQLEISQVSIGNEKEAYVRHGPFGEQSAPSSPQLHLTIANHSSSAVYLRAVRVTIEDSARFPICIPSQGGGPIPESNYPITLPLPPVPPGTVSTYRLRERIGPGERDYPAFYFGVRRAESEEKVLYALRIELVTDDGKRLGVGRVLFAIPGSISIEEGSYLPFNEESLDYLAKSYAGSEPTRLRSTWCFRRALDSLRRLTGRPGLRSADLATLATLEPAPSWDRYADPRSPRAAAEVLLRADPDAPILAAYAASTTGDAGYAAEMRRRAAAALRRAVEAEMRDSYWGPDTVERARESLALSDSPAGRSLLRRVELGLQG